MIRGNRKFLNGLAGSILRPPELQTKSSQVHKTVMNVLEIPFESFHRKPRAPPLKSNSLNSKRQTYEDFSEIQSDLGWE